MQDHDVGEAVGGGGGALGEAGAFDFGHDVGGGVADCAGVAVVLVGSGRGLVLWVGVMGEGWRGGCNVRDGRDIEDAVAELDGFG